MKFNSLMKFPFKGRYWDYVITGVGSAGGSKREYFQSGTVKFTGGLGPASNLVIYTKVALRDFAQVDDIRDQHGTQVVPWEKQAQGAVFEVRSNQPILNAFGYVEGYRVTLVRL